jgi:hypothetical protein
MAKSKAQRGGKAKKGGKTAATAARSGRGAKAPKKAARGRSAAKAAKKAPPRRPARAAKKTAKPVAKRASAQKKPAAAKKAAPVKVRPQKAAAKKAVPRRAPTLDRDRRIVAEPETHGVPSSLGLEPTASAARTGRRELADKLAEHTSTGPALTAGDIDADWESAETVGDEAPGGDNPTPDQDVVDDIGRALGVEYDDDEELQGGDEIVARDRNRWELDPASKDDFDEEE